MVYEKERHGKKNMGFSGSMMTRSGFMKGLGLVGAGAGAVALGFGAGQVAHASAVGHGDPWCTGGTCECALGDILVAGVSPLVNGAAGFPEIKTYDDFNLLWNYGFKNIIPWLFLIDSGEENWIPVKLEEEFVPVTFSFMLYDPVFMVQLRDIPFFF